MFFVISSNLSFGVPTRLYLTQWNVPHYASHYWHARLGTSWHSLLTNTTTTCTASCNRRTSVTMMGLRGKQIRKESKQEKREEVPPWFNTHMVPLDMLVLSHPAKYVWEEVSLDVTYALVKQRQRLQGNKTRLLWMQNVWLGQGGHL